MDNNNSDRLSDNNISTDCIDDSVTVSASASGQNGNIEVSEPEEFVVSTLEDENDGDFNDGDLSLREAIALANEQEGADTITFDSSLNGGTIVLNSGELAINDSLTILGLGSEQLTIDGNEASRVFNLDDGNAETEINVAINGLKITGGNASTEDLGTFGGGIFNQENLELNDSLVTANTAVAGGGIYNQNATASINNSAIDNNSTSGGASGVANRGSGIANFNSTVEINNSSIDDNTNTGIEANESEITIVDSSISGNSGLGTGGIRSYRSTVNLENSTVSNNSASALGNSGGITSTLDSVLNINNSTVSDNFGDSGSPDDPRARMADASGILTSGTANIANSTISNNRGIGIGIKNSGDLNITNSTFSGNAGTGIFNQGNGSVDVSNSTIANNQGDSDAGGVQNENDSVDSFVLSSNIIANNSGSADLGGEAFTSEGNNLIGNGNDVDGFVDSDLVGTDDSPINPQLGELQDNGGLTETLALQEDSPAIDAGSNSDNLTFDQRGEGFDRTVGDATDIGAYEVQDNGGGQMNEELVVSTLEDENDGDYSEGDLSLREAISLANDNQTITFDSSLSDRSIILSQGSLLIDRSINIDGLGANNLTIDANHSFRIFLVDDGNDDSQADVSVSGLTLKDGYSFDSDISYLDGGGFLNRENLTVSDSILTGNRAGNGGAIFNTGNLQFENSLVTKSDGTGPINNDGGTVSIVNSTFTDNHVPGVSAIVNNNGGTLELTNSTITENSGYGAALFNSEDSTATVASTIVANNLAELPEEEGKDDILGNYISQGNNLIGTTQGGSGFDNESDLVGTEGNAMDPKLGELQDNGGSTQTIALLEGSPAIDAGSNPNNLETDQRGEGFNRTVGEGTDIGAYEVQEDDNGETPTELVVSTLEDENDGDYSDGDLSLREAIALSNQQEGADTITFNDGLSGNIVLTQGQLTIVDSVTIDGNNGQNLTIDGNNSDRIFKIDDGNSETNADVTLDGLVIENGNVDNRDTDNIGGGILNQENLTVVRSTISYNSAEQGGGIANQGNLTLQSSYVDNNYAFEAGGIYTITGNNQIIDSSINNNESNFNSGGLLVENATIDIENSLIDGNSTGAAYGGISINNSTANINNSTIANNDGGGNAGGISSASSITTINNSTITGNSAASNGGIIAGSSGDSIEAVVTINNSTITGNSATVNQGGGIKNYIDSTMNINNSTITGNFAAQGAAGVYQQESFIAPDDLPEDVIISGTLNLTSSIVAGNENDRDLGGDSFNSGGNNLIGNGNGFEDYFNESSGDIVGTSDNPIDPELGELQENGGLTQTIALQEDSPAIDMGNNANNLVFDQRGEGFDRTVGNGTDIGAYEVQTTISSEEIIGTDDSDRLDGTSVDDKIRGLAGDDFIRGLQGNDSIYGDGGNDHLNGNAGDDLIDGGEGRDRIYGGIGDDTLSGSAGNDYLLGGAGNDIYVYNLNADEGFIDRDLIRNFKPGEDKIAFSSIANDPQFLDSFDDLDTNGSGVLDSNDERVQIIGHSTVIDLSDIFGRTHGSDMITFLDVTNLDESNFLFNETAVDAEFG